VYLLFVIQKVSVKKITVAPSLQAAVDLSTLSANLRRLRISKGKTQATIAEAAGISRVGYRNVEAGSVVPRADTLVAIANALAVGVDDLLTPVRTLQAVRFRAQKRMTTRDQVLVDVARRLGDYNELESLIGAAPPFRFGKAQKELAGLQPGDGRAERAAAFAREAVQLGRDDLIRDPCGLLEDNGVKVLTPSIASEGFFGLSVHQADGGPAVIVNVWDRISVERWIFTAAHELGHLLLHANAFDVGRSDEVKSEEREADAFASKFLMPDHLFEKEWSEACGLDLVERVFKVKRIFRVSYRTVLYRVASKSPRPRDVWIRFQVEYRKRSGHTLGGSDEPQRLSAAEFRGRPPAHGADEPERLLGVDFVKDRLSRLVRRAIEQNAISIGRAGEILRISPDEMRDRATSWRIAGA
jgi:Zn-dependent peptidase ImmA (M78 family)/transcriptional regulator with XRE-family HTH domain